MKYQAVYLHPDDFKVLTRQVAAIVNMDEAFASHGVYRYGGVDVIEDERVERGKPRLELSSDNTGRSILDDIVCLDVM